MYIVRGYQLLVNRRKWWKLFNGYRPPVGKYKGLDWREDSKHRHGRRGPV